MKKLVCLLLALMLFLTVSAPAMADKEDRVIRVSGNATVSLSADTASIQIGVTTRKESVQEAQEENALLMNAVIEAILKIGVEEKDISTSQFDVFSTYEYVPDANGREIEKKFFQVSNMLHVTIRELDKVGAVLDTAVEAGANTTYGITFSSSKENEAYQKALTRAVEDAANKAQILADAAGKKLGDLFFMDASQQNSYYGISNTFNAKADGADTAIVSGDVFVSATVVMEYSFK